MKENAGTGLCGWFYSHACKKKLNAQYGSQMLKDSQKEYYAIIGRAKDIGPSRPLSASRMAARFIALNRSTEGGERRGFRYSRKRQRPVKGRKKMRLKTTGTINFSLLCGILGCLCFGAGDWLMIYGDTAHRGSLPWLTVGAAKIAPWRNSLAMALAFPGILLYGIALFAIAAYLNEERQRKAYRRLTAFSLTPWLCLHLFYIMILYAFAWMNGSGYEAAALPVSEALFRHLSWLVIVSEILMLPPYLYWFQALIWGNSAFPKGMALSNPLLFYTLLKLLTMFMPDSSFRLAFTNGLMSESMLLWFGSMLLWNLLHKNSCLEGNDGKY